MADRDHRGDRRRRGTRRRRRADTLQHVLDGDAPFFVAAAHHPFGTTTPGDPLAYGVACRYGRILFPLSGWLLAFGRVRAVNTALLAVYVLSFGAWVAFAAEHLRRNGRRSQRVAPRGPRRAVRRLRAELAGGRRCRARARMDLPSGHHGRRRPRGRAGQLALPPLTHGVVALAALIPFFGIAVFRHMGEAFRVMVPMQALLLIVVLDRRSVLVSSPDRGVEAVAPGSAGSDGAVDPLPV